MNLDFRVAAPSARKALLVHCGPGGRYIMASDAPQPGKARRRRDMAKRPVLSASDKPKLRPALIC
jgi:hypothetical protein